MKISLKQDIDMTPWRDRLDEIAALAEAGTGDFDEDNMDEWLDSYMDRIAETPEPGAKLVPTGGSGLKRFSQAKQASASKRHQ
jgi:hypothetical protein